MRKSLLITSLLATSFLACGVAAMNNVSAKAETADFATAFGASVRVTEPNGIRFKLQLSESKKAEIFAENSGKELGMYILLGSKAGTDYSTLTQKVEIEFEEKDLYKEGDAWYANGVMTNLYVQSFNKEFVGVGYIATTTAEGTTYEYSAFNAQDNVRSMSSVALEAYKAEDNQEAMLALLEKAAYAEYGVVETRKTVDGVINYTFAKGEDSWTSYAAMQDAIPVSIAAEEGNLLVGETLDLGAALAINGTKLTKLDLPFTYTVEGNAVTVENGVAKAVGAGTANVTVAFGEWSKTVAVNVQEAANVVFNPASPTAASQVTYNWLFDDANGTRKLVSAEENTNETYGDAYMYFKTTKTGWGNVFVKPAHEMSAYTEYDAVSAWIYVESTKAENLNATFLGADIDLSRLIPTNQWMQVTIPMDKFMEKGDGSVNFSSINYTASIKAVAIGEIVAINYEDTPEVVFNPAMGNVMQVKFIETTATGTTFSNIGKQFVPAAQNTDETYSGAYLKVNPNNLTDAYKYGNIDVTPLNVSTAYADYTHVKVWFYVETTTNTTANLTIGGTMQAVASNQWLSIDIALADFIEKADFVINWRKNTSWGIVGLRIGEITAFKEVRTDVFVFDPTSETATSQIKGGHKAFGYFNNTTVNVVTSNADSTYNGAYVRVGSTVIDSSVKWGRVFVTLAPNDTTDYSAYTAVKTYVYIESADSGSLNLSFAGHTAQSVTKNQWTEVIIPMDKFIAATTQAAASAQPSSGIFVEMNFSTTAVTAIRIGEITAVK